ncbi:MAG: HDOD domain-containing protein [Azoarcus sp.]|jgi:HD-like signal output (HDOD) protein|nr:HDOD domain-containing protein [Azoarcus sp.]
MYSAQELVSNIEDLAVLPSVYHRVREQLESPDGSVTEVARLVAADPALTTGVLRLVNSAFYGFARKIESVERAIPILGLQQTHELVLAMSVSAIFEGIKPQRMNMKRFWHGCMMCALASREIAYMACNPAGERMFVIGLLADIGHLVMYQTVPTLAVEARARAEASGIPLHEAERHLIGCDHAEIGATLMDAWHLPPSFAEIIGAQIVPQLGGEYVREAELLHVAIAVARADHYNMSSDEAAARISAQIWNGIGLKPWIFARAREAAELHLAASIATFFPRM